MSVVDTFLILAVALCTVTMISVSFSPFLSVGYFMLDIFVLDIAEPRFKFNFASVGQGGIGFGFSRAFSLGKCACPCIQSM
jgi:hypothetical protein